MTIDIKFFGITVFVIWSNLETIKVFDIVECLVAIEVLQIGYTYTVTIEESAHSCSIPELSTHFEIHIVCNRQFPFIKVGITAKDSTNAFIVFQFKYRSF